MKVIVCGAGQVGSTIARRLSAESNDVVVIDQSPELIRKLSESLDVQALQGLAGHPDIMEKAGAADADMVIAVTRMDEVNMVACQVAHSLFNVPTKIARIRSQSYLAPIWADLFSREHMPIDVIISPERDVAHAIGHQLQAPGAFDMISLLDGGAQAVGVHCTRDCPIINTPLRQLTELFPDLNITVVGIGRDETMMVPDDDEQMREGDDVYFIAETSHVPRAMATFGHEEPEVARVIVVGGGNIGLFLAQELEQRPRGPRLKVIERVAERAETVAQMLEKATVLRGDALDPDILAEANVGETDAIVCVTNEDEINILSGLLAKRLGARSAFALVNNMNFDALVTNLGVDAVINPQAVTVSNILRHVRRGRIRSVHSLREGWGEIVEAEALETSSLVGRPLREIKLPWGIIVGAIRREGEVLIPKGSTVIQTHDEVVLYAASEAAKKVEKMFSVRLEYF